MTASTTVRLQVVAIVGWGAFALAALTAWSMHQRVNAADRARLAAEQVAASSVSPQHLRVLQEAAGVAEKCAGTVAALTREIVNTCPALSDRLRAANTPQPAAPGALVPQNAAATGGSTPR